MSIDLLAPLGASRSDKKKKEEIRIALLSPPSSNTLHTRWDVPFIKEKFFNFVDISTSAITSFLKKLGKSFITGRPAHPKKNLAINEKWERDCFLK